tara:strand:- start:5982 stop:6680 length:699 start_codon:yes stop_codon:yes gene_type:complete
VDGKPPVDLRATLFHFLGEVEVIFGIWVLPLLLVLTLFKGWTAAYQYIDGRNYTEPLFVVVIMAIAASRPVVSFAGNLLRRVARLGHLRPSAWWLSILTFAPMLGSLITEPAAMTIAAMLLGREFYRYKPTERFKYATLGRLDSLILPGVDCVYSAPSRFVHWWISLLPGVYDRHGSSPIRDLFEVSFAGWLFSGRPCHPRWPSVVVDITSALFVVGSAIVFRLDDTNCFQR